MRKNLTGLGRCSRCLRRATAEVVYVAEPGQGPVARKLCDTHLATVERGPTPVQVRRVSGQSVRAIRT